MKYIFELFLTTLSFLTILPSKRISKNFGFKMFIFFPFVGLLIGIVCFLLIKFFKRFFSLEVSVIFTLFFYVLISDYLHLDGFVDTIDAMFGSIKKEYVEILKDPHIGVVGCIFLFMVLLTKYFLFFNNKELVYILTPVFSKTGLVFVGLFGRKLTDGIGEKFLHKSFFVTILSSVFSLMIFLLILRNILYSLFFVFLCFLFSFVIVSFFNKKFGGVSGDTFGFINEILEILFLTIFAGSKI